MVRGKLGDADKKHRIRIYIEGKIITETLANAGLPVDTDMAKNIHAFARLLEDTLRKK